MRTLPRWCCRWHSVEFDENSSFHLSPARGLEERWSLASPQPRLQALCGGFHVILERSHSGWLLCVRRVAHPNARVRLSCVWLNRCRHPALLDHAYCLCVGFHAMSLFVFRPVVYPICGEALR